MAPFSPQAVFLALGADDKNRQGANRALFRASLDQVAIDDLRLALNQNQPLGNCRFILKIDRETASGAKLDRAYGQVRTLRLREVRAAKILSAPLETRPWPL